MSATNAMKTFAIATLTCLLATGVAHAQPIVAQPAGLANPSQVFDFGSGNMPNFTPVTTQFQGLVVSHARYYTTGANTNNLSYGFLLNDFSGPPDTVSLTFATPITDVSFVYHQVGTGGQTTMRALLQGVVVDSFSGQWTQSQPNNFFGFANTVLDEVQIDFDADFNLDTVAIRPELSVAECRITNGTGVNPVDFTCQTLPVLGTTWTGTVASEPGTIMTGLMFAPGGPLTAPVPLFGGELLIQVAPAPTLFTSAGSYSIAIPSAPSWLGAAFTFQGMRLYDNGGALRIRPLNVVTIVLGT